MDETSSHQLKAKSDKLLAVDGDGKKGIVNSFFICLFLCFLQIMRDRIVALIFNFDDIQLWVVLSCS
jgi:hypothetical protein